MNQHLLGNPKLTVTHVNEVKAGINHIVVDSVQYGNQEMIMEKDVTVEMRDGENYILIFSDQIKMANSCSYVCRYLR